MTKRKIECVDKKHCLTTYSSEVEVDFTNGGFVGVNTDWKPGNLGGFIVLVTVTVCKVLPDPK